MIFGVKKMSTAVSTISRTIADWTLGAESTFDELLSEKKVLPTGIALLDEALDGGLPVGKLIEIYPQRTGRCEVGLLLGVLRHFERVTWVLDCTEPLLPYQEGLRAAGLDLSRQLMVAPATAKDAFWCVEQALLSGECDAIVAWLPPLSSKEDARAMARLSLAASHGRVSLFIIRPFVMSGVNSPADMRIQLFVEHDPRLVRARIHTDTYIWARPVEATFPLNFIREFSGVAQVAPAANSRAFPVSTLKHAVIS